MKLLNIAVIATQHGFKQFDKSIVNQYGNINFIHVQLDLEVLRAYELGGYLLHEPASTMDIDKLKEIVSIINSRIR